MAYAAQRLSQPSTPKKAVRWPVAVAVTVSGSGLGHHAAEIQDLSRTGFKLAMQCKFVRGDLVLVTIPTFTPLAAKVVWSNGLEAGLKFVSPLALVVLETIAARHSREGSIDF